MSVGFPVGRLVTPKPAHQQPHHLILSFLLPPKYPGKHHQSHTMSSCSKVGDIPCGGVGCLNSNRCCATQIGCALPPPGLSVHLNTRANELELYRLLQYGCDLLHQLRQLWMLGDNGDKAPRPRSLYRLHQSHYHGRPVRSLFPVLLLVIHPSSSLFPRANDRKRRD